MFIYMIWVYMHEYDTLCDMFLCMGGVVQDKHVWHMCVFLCVCKCMFECVVGGTCV